ncbi:MAG: CRISPR-associated endonuclease Cas1 [Polyangia bacterium]|jgi:CRISPR-associated protein Cas1
MRTVYVTEKGATLRREGALLRLVLRGESLAEISAHDLGQMVLMGNVSLTPGALDLLLERNVDTVFLTHHGRFRARLTGGLSTNVRLRLAQYRCLVDPDLALAAARSIVEAKIANSRTFIQRFRRRHGERDELVYAERALGAARLRTALCSTLDEVRGCEGSAAAAYFRAFGSLIRVPGFSFDGRNRHPPLDPVNALLSLGYTLLANNVEAAIEVVGLDPYLGSLHAPAPGRPSLACDLMEEFRVPAVDALVVAALNRGAIPPEGFEDAGPGEPVVMRKETVRAFVHMFESRMRGPAQPVCPGAAATYRGAIEAQVRRFARYLTSEERPYQPYRPR